MRCAVLKLGGRICVNNNGKNGVLGETLSLINILIEANIEVDAYTKILSKDQIPNNFNIYDINKGLQDKHYDCLIVINGNINFFGGQEDKEQILNYKIINNFKGKVFYLLCDPLLIFKQIWNVIENKEWKVNWNKKDINVIRDDIIYITQCKNILETKKYLEKTKNSIIPKNIFYFPFHKFPLLFFENNNIDYNEVEYDISYGGTFRSGRREKDMIKFYFNYPDDIKVEMFGNIKLSQFKNIDNLNAPIINPPVKYIEFQEKMKKAISTIIIGDKLYKQLDDLAQRIYESIMIGNIVFIDNTYDKEKRIFKHDKLRKFCYVENKDDVLKRLYMIKNNPYLFDVITKLQKQDVSINKKEYCNNLKEMIRKEI